MKFKSKDCHLFDLSKGIHADQTVQLLTEKSRKAHPRAVRSVEFFFEK